jgi:hypothetical protein
MKFNHLRMFTHALRTSLLFVAGFLIYDILKGLEKMWNIENPGNELYHLYQRKLYKLILLFTIDLFILYAIAFLFKIHH